MRPKESAKHLLKDEIPFILLYISAFGFSDILIKKYFTSVKYQILYYIFVAVIGLVLYVDF